jgi:hypothetical protein
MSSLAMAQFSPGTVALYQTLAGSADTVGQKARLCK